MNDDLKEIQFSLRDVVARKLEEKAKLELNTLDGYEKKSKEDKFLTFNPRLREALNLMKKAAPREKEAMRKTYNYNMEKIAKAVELTSFMLESLPSNLKEQSEEKPTILNGTLDKLKTFSASLFKKEKEEVKEKVDEPVEEDVDVWYGPHRFSREHRIARFKKIFDFKLIEGDVSKFTEEEQDRFVEVMKFIDSEILINEASLIFFLHNEKIGYEEHRKIEKREEKSAIEMHFYGVFDDYWKWLSEMEKKDVLQDFEIYEGSSDIINKVYEEISTRHQDVIDKQNVELKELDKEVEQNLKLLSKMDMNDFYQRICGQAIFQCYSCEHEGIINKFKAEVKKQSNPASYKSFSDTDKSL